MIPCPHGRGHHPATHYVTAGKGGDYWKAVTCLTHRAVAERAATRAVTWAGPVTLTPLPDEVQPEPEAALFDLGGTP